MATCLTVPQRVEVVDAAYFTHKDVIFFFPLLYLEGTQHQEGRKSLAFKSTKASTSSNLSLGERDAVNAYNVYV